MSSRVKVDRDILGGGWGVTGNHRMLGFVGRVSKLLMFYHYTPSDTNNRNTVMDENSGVERDLYKERINLRST